jgi:ATP-dependent Clp protease ATP-binding subunit ClpC
MKSIISSLKDFRDNVNKVDTFNLEGYTADAASLIVNAQALADANKHEKVESLHLLMQMTDVKGFTEALSLLDIKTKDFSLALTKELDTLNKSDTVSYLSPNTKSLLNSLKKNSKEEVDVEDILRAIAREPRGASFNVLQTFKLKSDSLDPYLAGIKEARKGVEHLSKYTKDITDLVKGDKYPLVGREADIQRLTQILGRRSKNHPILIGEPGVGKTAIVNALAKLINSGDVPEDLKEAQILKLEMNELFSGTKLRGEVDERIKQVISFIKDNTIVFIDEIDSVIGSGVAGGSIGEVLKPILSAGSVRFFASTTPDGARKMQEKDANFFRKFTPVFIEPPSMDQAIAIVKSVVPKYEKYHAVKINDDAVIASVKLAKRYIQDRALPESAIDIIDEAASKKRFKKNTTIEESDVASIISDCTGIPISKMLEAENNKLMKMEERIGRRVVGQLEAVNSISKSVRRSRVGLRNPNKPIGSFLFLGPSGVGKTEIAKALAEFLFDDEQAMTRIDMSEFMEKHMAQRLVGAPPGYADSDQGGFLTEAVRKRPYSVLLFDEVEKAHADVFNLLLQVLDDGRLTDGRGRTADFSNTVVIMTSNIGGNMILEKDESTFSTEDGRESLKDDLLHELRNFMRPEFINRIDDIVVFHPLSKRDLRGIVDIELNNLQKTLADREITLNVSDPAKMLLVEMSYDPPFGARPLKRSILKKIQDPLAEKILAGNYKPGHVVTVDSKGTKLLFG